MQLLDRPAVNSAALVIIHRTIVITAITADLIGAVEALGYRSSIVMPLDAVNALEAQYRPPRILDHAIASADETFRLTAAFVVELVTTINIVTEAERARQAGKKSKADALSARVTKLLTTARSRLQ